MALERVRSEPGSAFVRQPTVTDATDPRIRTVDDVGVRRPVRSAGEPA
ncbi:hypothetical protein ACIOG7_28830 [Streptomyces sp. NPDC087894]